MIFVLKLEISLNLTSFIYITSFNRARTTRNEKTRNDVKAMKPLDLNNLFYLTGDVIQMEIFHRSHIENGNAHNDEKTTYPPIFTLRFTNNLTHRLHI